MNIIGGLYRVGKNVQKSNVRKNVRNSSCKCSNFFGEPIIHMNILTIHIRNFAFRKFLIASFVFPIFLTVKGLLQCGKES